MKAEHKEFNKRRKEHFESGTLVAWHGMSIEHFHKALKNNQFEAHTSQRYWQDGLTKKDNHPDYEKSYWLRGWSLSRDKTISMRFGDILVEMDLGEIKKKLSIQPISWNYTISQVKKLNHKKEQEEFVIAHRGDICLMDKMQEQVLLDEKLDALYEEMHKTPENKRSEILKKIDELTDYYNTNWYEKVYNEPVGKSLPFSVVKGFFTKYREDSKTLYSKSSQEKLEELKKHPLYLGEFNPVDFEVKIDKIIDKEHVRKKVKI